MNLLMTPRPDEDPATTHLLDRYAVELAIDAAEPGPASLASVARSHLATFAEISALLVLLLHLS